MTIKQIFCSCILYVPGYVKKPHFEKKLSCFSFTTLRNQTTEYNFPTYREYIPNLPEKDSLLEV